ncbi:hypothetical protein DFH09DRAFT_1307230 [Mycena vulgaris]|nr:hypothetical protein DFH09DRAFT_1307230 [Mycena vulgaris]
MAPDGRLLACLRLRCRRFLVLLARVLDILVGFAPHTFFHLSSSTRPRTPAALLSLALRTRTRARLLRPVGPPTHAPYLASCTHSLPSHPDHPAPPPPPDGTTADESLRGEWLAPGARVGALVAAAPRRGRPYVY